ncbi:MAG: hypothetical protein ACTSP9_07675 [Promethearchaeota archaeon]
MPSKLNDHDFFKDDEEATCCDNAKISEEDGFYVCMNCGFVYSRILDDSPRRAFTQDHLEEHSRKRRFRNVKVMKESIVQ